MKKPIKLLDLRVIWIIWRNPFFTEPVFSCVGSVLRNTGGLVREDYFSILLRSERFGFSQKLSLNHVNST